ncbi:MAG: hypothetical protein QXJ05_05430 [Nitrososphaerota archaeon]
MSWQRLYEIIAKATILAVILTIPPIAGLFLIWRYGERSPFSILVWLVFTLLWNTFILMLFIKGILFRDAK